MAGGGAPSLLSGWTAALGKLYATHRTATALAVIALLVLGFVWLSRRVLTGRHGKGVPTSGSGSDAELLAYRRRITDRRFAYRDGYWSSVREKYASDQFTMGLKARGGTWSGYPQWYANTKRELLAALPAGTRVKAVYFLRHGKGIHNTAEDEFGSERWEAVEAKHDKYEDAALNALGIAQCATMRRAVRGALALRDTSTDPHTPVWRPQLIVTSPLSRAIETARRVFSDYDDDGGDGKSSSAPSGLWSEVPVVSLEFARETIGKNTCDRRKPVSVLQRLYPNIAFREGFATDHDALWTPQRETDAQIDDRARQTLEWLFRSPSAAAQGAEHVVVSSHNGFIAACLRVLGYPVDVPPHHFTLRNCEMVPLVIAFTPDKH